MDNVRREQHSSVPHGTRMGYVARESSALPSTAVRLCNVRSYSRGRMRAWLHGSSLLATTFRKCCLEPTTNRRIDKKGDILNVLFWIYPLTSEGFHLTVKQYNGRESCSWERRYLQCNALFEIYPLTLRFSKVQYSREQLTTTLESIFQL